MKYPEILSAIKPVPHRPGIPVPIPPNNSSDKSNSEEEICESNKGETFQTSSETKPLTQAGLNDLTRDLCLSKESAQLLGSRPCENR